MSRQIGDSEPLSRSVEIELTLEIGIVGRWSGGSLNLVKWTDRAESYFADRPPPVPVPRPALAAGRASRLRRSRAFTRCWRSSFSGG